MPEVVPIHTGVKGRARLRVAELHRNENLKRLIESRLIGRDIRRVEASSLTGNLLIFYEPDRPLEAILGHVRAVLAEPDGDAPAGAAAQAWHAHDPARALAAFDSAESGLPPAEAARRQRVFGPNLVPEIAPRSRAEILLAQFGGLPVALLAASALLSLATGGVVDAAVIASVIVINSGIGFFAEARADETIRSLAGNEAGLARVVRAGGEQAVAVEEVVPGDVVALHPGDFVPADARLIETDQLTVNEASLTGESLPVAKAANVLARPEAPLADRRNMVFRGTVVSGGSGRGVVVACGRDTEIGHVQALLGSAAAPPTPLQRHIDMLSRQLVFGSAGLCVAIFAIGLLRGFGFLAMLKTAISLAVAAVPEGLPTLATTTLALGIENLRGERVLVRRLGAVEGFAAIGVVCLDKTGTLTLNRMSVVRLAAAGRPPVQPADALAGGRDGELRLLLELGALCNDAEIADAAAEAHGSSTELALLEAAAEAGIDVRELRRAQPRFAARERSETRRFMLTAHRSASGAVLIALKGDPHDVLGLCRARQQGGVAAPLDPTERARILGQNAAMARDGLRVLGIAFRLLPESAALPPEPPAEFVWVGLVGMADPLRHGMAELIAGLHRAGIRAAMITGDQPETAAAIGRELGLDRLVDIAALGRPEQPIDGAVFARVAPAQKLDIIRALQQRGLAVAMIGDGVNDTPSLKAADIGITLESAGTEAARQVADVVLLADDLTGIIRASAYGRTVYANLRKSLRFLLATNLSEMLLMLFAVATGIGQPLTPVQLLWINLLTDILPALGLAFEPPEPDVMQRPPPDPAAPIVPRRDLAILARDAAIMAGGALAAQAVAAARYGAGERSRGAGFASLVTSQLLYALNCRSTEAGWTRLPPNPYLLGALGLSFAAQGAALFAPGLSTLIGAPIGGFDLAAALATGGLPMLAIETAKRRH
ncbi:MAG TPA: cation-transporting P-type ATPase [Stellaceae bacterium]|nr:cation-transporting P-type ATPase [Stellaceae bacterium]